MDIEQLRSARHAMETSILDAAAKAMEEFHAKTGMTPEAIDINLVRTEQIGKRYPLYVINSVKATVDS